MFKEDLPTVHKVLSELDPERYYYHIPSADTHSHVILKTEDFENELKNRKALFIDIFVIERAPSKPIRSKLHRFNGRLFMLSMSLVYMPESEIGQRLVRWIPKTIKRFNGLLVDKGSEMTMIYSASYRRNIRPRSAYGEPVVMEFEDTEMPVPCDWDAILKERYGDYMTLPPEDERMGAVGFPHRVYQDYLRDTK